MYVRTNLEPNCKKAVLLKILGLFEIKAFKPNRNTLKIKLIIFQSEIIYNWPIFCLIKNIKNAVHGKRSKIRDSRYKTIADKLMYK